MVLDYDPVNNIYPAAVRLSLSDSTVDSGQWIRNPVMSRKVQIYISAFPQQRLGIHRRDALSLLQYGLDAGRSEMSIQLCNRLIHNAVALLDTVRMGHPFCHQPHRRSLLLRKVIKPSEGNARHCLLTRQSKHALPLPGRKRES